jgi:hypothetical protein
MSLITEGSLLWQPTPEVIENANLTQDHDQMENYTARVIAPTARDAAQWAAQFVATRACVEITVWGTRGGCAHHKYWGWERAIWNGMCQERGQTQLGLKLVA